MADPVFDEDEIIACLRAPVTDDTLTVLQDGAMKALLDLYDRKVTRDEFIKMASPCVALYGHINKMWLLASILGAFTDKKLTESAFTEANATITSFIRRDAEVVVEHVKRLKMCPTSQDAVH